MICSRKDGTSDISVEDLQLGKLYEVVDKDVGHGMVRIIDESGEDYLNPAVWFDEIILSAAASKQLAESLPYR